MDILDDREQQDQQRKNSSGSSAPSPVSSATTTSEQVRNKSPSDMEDESQIGANTYDGEGDDSSSNSLSPWPSQKVSSTSKVPSTIAVLARQSLVSPLVLGPEGGQDDDDDDDDDDGNDGLAEGMGQDFASMDAKEVRDLESIKATSDQNLKESVKVSSVTSTPAQHAVSTKGDSSSGAERGNGNSNYSNIINIITASQTYNSTNNTPRRLARSTPSSSAMPMPAKSWPLTATLSTSMQSNTEAVTISSGEPTPPLPTPTTPGFGLEEERSFQRPLYSKGVMHLKPSTGLLSPSNQSSMADINNLSSATITTNLLGISSHVFDSHIFHQKDHQQPRLVPIEQQPCPHHPTSVYQLSTPSVSSNSLAVSRPVSPTSYSSTFILQTSPSAQKSEPLSVQPMERPNIIQEKDTDRLMENHSVSDAQIDDSLPTQAEHTADGSRDSRLQQRRLPSTSFSSTTSSSATFTSLAERQEVTFAEVQHSKSFRQEDTVLGNSPTRSESHHSHHDRYLATVFDDLKAKTHQALRKAGLFSMAPDAGLYADRGSSRPADMKVIRMFPAPSESSATMAVSSIEGNGKESSDLGRKKEGKEGKEGAKGIFGRPRSRSVKETCRAFLSLDSSSSQRMLQSRPLPPVPRIPRLQVSTTLAATPMIPPEDRPAMLTPPPPSPSSLSFAGRFDKLRPWARASSASTTPPGVNGGGGGSGGHQRSNSGPARSSDLRILCLFPLQSSSTNQPYTPTSLSPQVMSEKDPTTYSKETTIEESGEDATSKINPKLTHRRRKSEAMSMFSFKSGGFTPSSSSLKQERSPTPPPPPSSATTQYSTPQEKSHQRSKITGHWFGPKRHHHQQQRSIHSVDGEDVNGLASESNDVKKLEHIPQWKVPGAFGNRPRSVVLIEGDFDQGSHMRVEVQGDPESQEEEEEEDEESDSGDDGMDASHDSNRGKPSSPSQSLDSSSHALLIGSDPEEASETPKRKKKKKKSVVYVNDYGFIFNAEAGQDIGNRPVSKGGQVTGSRLSPNHHNHHHSATATSSDLIGDGASSFLEHERERLLKKQREFTHMSENKWIYAMAHLQPDQVKKSSKYKKLVRAGIPNSIRGRVWQFLANTDRYREPGLFQKLLLRGHLPIHDVIARDIHRCYPDHVHFRDGMGGTGQEDLHAILKAYAHYKPSVGYCQGMGRLVGMMLMQMPVEDAFWLLVATIESPYLQDYYTPTLRQLRVDAIVFERLLKVQDPKLATFLERNDVGPLMYMTQWYLTLFTMSLPWASVLRVWDVFYFDGIKTLFRVGLGVLQICRPHLLAPHRVGNNGGHHTDNGARAFFSGSDSNHHNNERRHGDSHIGMTSGLESGEVTSADAAGPADVMEYLLHVPLEILGPERLLERAFRIRLRRESLEKMTVLAAAEMDKKELIDQEKRRIRLQQQQQQRAAAQEAALSVQLQTQSAIAERSPVEKSRPGSVQQVHWASDTQEQESGVSDPERQLGTTVEKPIISPSDTVEVNLPGALVSLESDSFATPSPQEADRPHSQPSKRSSIRSFMASTLPASSSSSTSSLTLQQAQMPSLLSTQPLEAPLASISGTTLSTPHTMAPSSPTVLTPLDKSDQVSAILQSSALLPSSTLASTLASTDSDLTYKATMVTTVADLPPPPSPSPSPGIFSFRTRKRAGTVHQ